MIKGPWRKSMPSTSVRESERTMSGALQDDRYMDNWIQEEEKLVWPTCYPDHQPPILRLMNLETIIEDATGENYCGAAQSKNVDRPSRPLTIYNALEVGSLSQKDCGTKRILSPDDEEPLERIVTVQSLSLAEFQVEYLKGEDPMAKPVPNFVTTSAAEEEKLALLA